MGERGLLFPDAWSAGPAWGAQGLQSHLHSSLQYFWFIKFFDSEKPVIFILTVHYIYIYIYRINIMK